MSSPEKTVRATSYVPKRVVQSFRNENAPLESNVSECLAGVVLCVVITTEKKTSINYLNKNYLEPLITICESFGGDIIQLTYDTMLVLWQWDDLTAHTELKTAALCALQIQKLQDSPDKTCYAKVGIAADKNIFFATLGGFEGRWKFLLSGNALKHTHLAVKEPTPNWSIVISAETWQFMQEFCNGNGLKSGFVELLGVKRESSIPRDIGLKTSTLPPLAYSSETPKGLEMLLSTYLPTPIQNTKDDSQLQLWFSLDRSTVRYVTVLFVTLANIQLEWNSESTVQKALYSFQVALDHYKGEEFDHWVDEKGVNFVGVFGSPSTISEEHFSRAVLAAIEIQRQLKALKLEVRIGICSGKAQFGLIGSKTRKAYSFKGRLLAKASLIAMFASSSQILCGSKPPANSREEEIGLFFNQVETGSGKNKNVFYEPLVQLEQEHAVHSDLQPSLLLRKNLLQEFIKKLEALNNRDTQNASLIEGESGSGKSFLAKQILQEAQKYPFLVLRGKCEAHEKSTPFFPLRPMIKQIFESRVLTNGKDIPMEEQFKMLPYVREHVHSALNLLFPDEYPICSNSNGKPVSEENMFHMIRELLIGLTSAISKRRSLLIVLEDIQWMDAQTMSCLLQFIQDVVPGKLIMLSSRPNGIIPPLKQYLKTHPQNHFKLDKFSSEDIAEIVCNTLQVKALPRGISAVLAKSEGNPRSAIDLALKLREDGHIETRNSTCRLIRTVPFAKRLFREGTKEAVVNLFDRLTPAQQLILEIGSVLETFNKSTVCAFHIPLRQYHVGKQLYSLYEQGILKIVVSGAILPKYGQKKEETYAFGNMLWRETIYQLISPSRREHMHHQAAQLYEECFGEDPSEVYQTLAMHYSNSEICIDAVQRSSAIHYLEKAATQAKSKFAIDQATFFFEKLLELSEQKVSSDPMRVAKWERQLGECYMKLGSISQAIPHLEKCLLLHGQGAPGNTYLMVRLLLLVANQTSHNTKKNNDTISLEEGTLEIIQCFQSLSEAFFALRDLVKSTYCALQMGKYSAKLGPSPQSACFNATMCIIANVWGFKALAEKSLSTALEYTQQTQTPAQVAFVFHKTADYKFSQGRFQDCLRYCSQALAIVEAIGDRCLTAYSTICSAWCNLITGNLETALENSTKAMKITVDYGHLFTQAALTSCLIAQGNFDKASVILEQANHSVDVENGFVNSLIWTNKAIVRLYNGDLLSSLEITKRILALLVADQMISTVSYFTYENIAITIQGLYHCGVITQYQFNQMVKELLNAWRNYAKTFPMSNPLLSLYTVKFDRLMGNKQRAHTTAVSSLKTTQPHEYPYHHAALTEELGLLTNDTNLINNAKEKYEKLGFPKRESVFQHYVRKIAPQ